MINSLVGVSSGFNVVVVYVIVVEVPVTYDSKKDPRTRHLSFLCVNSVKNQENHEHEEEDTFYLGHITVVLVFVTVPVLVVVLVIVVLVIVLVCVVVLVFVLVAL